MSHHFNRHLRQQDVVDMNKLSALRVTLIGAGSIGSTTAIWLGKMGICNLTIFDDDDIQDHNWSNQMYKETDIGRPKVEALWDLMEKLCSLTPNSILQQYDGGVLSEVVISAVDSMTSRKSIWWQLRQQPQIKLYIDTRMGLETLIVHTVNPQVRDDRVRYTQTLHSDYIATQEPCTARSICYTPLMAASVVCSLVKRYVNFEEVPGRLIMDLATYTIQ